MFSGNLFILLLGPICILIFFFLLKTKASKKQLQRDNKVDWSWYYFGGKNNKIVDKNSKKGTVIEGESKEIKNDKEI